MHRIRRHRGDLLALLALFILPLLWFAPTLLPALSGRTLLPFDNLYTFEPWRHLHPGLIPHNDLLSDLVLENAVWKLHIRRTLAAGQLPLWNPQLFSGQPFFAAGQSSAAYPLSLLFYILPLDAAYGWFTAIQIGLAGVNMYILGRVLRLRIPAAFFSGVVFMFSGFLIASVVFTMFIAAVVWLPLLLGIIEVIIRKQEEKGVRSFRPIPYVIAGAIAIGLTILAGHPELIYYTLLVAGAYSAVRLAAAWRVLRKLKMEDLRLDGGDSGENEEIGVTETQSSTFNLQFRGNPTTRILKLAAWLLLMVALGVGLGAVQLIPLAELLPLNFRGGSATLEQVRGWAWPTRHVLTFGLPNVFGNPSHHRWFDIWNGVWVPATVNALGEPQQTIFWGVKNYVEGGNYLGIATWLLAAVAVVGGRRTNDEGRTTKDERRRTKDERRRTNDQRPTTNDERRTTNDQRSTAKNEGQTVNGQQSTGNSQQASFVVGRSSLVVRPPSGLRPVHLWFFVGLAAVSLLFAFGTPLYAVLYYGLPGWNQLHSPFRWVFPFTLSMAVLGGGGLSVLVAQNSKLKIKDWKAGIGRSTEARRPPIFNLQSSILFLPFLSILAGLTTLLLVAASLFAPEPFIALGQRIVDGSDLAQMAFADGRMFWSYQAANLVQFGVFALGAGAVVAWMAKKRKLKIEDLRLDDGEAGEDEEIGASDARSSGHLVTFAALLLIALTIADLWLAHGRFNPASPTALSPLSEAGVPPVVAFINQREGAADPQSPIVNPQSSMSFPLWRFTTFDAPGDKTFNANVGMYYGWQDIRGYDSIVPRQYVEFMNRIAPQENELLYNRIAPLYSNVSGDVYGGDIYAVLDNPLLDLLNVKYLLTEHYAPNPSWEEIYRDESMGVYENREVMPRAFIVPEARVVPPQEQPLTSADLRDVVFIEETPAATNALTRAGPQVAEANISRYTANDVFVDVNLSDRGWLVLTDAYFRGWKAYIRPFGGGENQETELPILRADSAFRTVYLPEAGQWTVRFVYSPMSFKLGLYISFLAFMTMLFLLLYWAWGKYYRPEATEGDVRTVAKNSLVPMTLNLSNKVIDFAFAMLYVRLLGPEGTGKYYFVVALYGFFEIVSRYGLGTLLTRDVAADKNRSSRYLTNVLSLRTLLWAVSMPVLALVTWFYYNLGSWGRFDVQSIGLAEVAAIAIFGLAMLFANWADAFSSTFFAFEKMEYPAGLSSATALFKVTVGAAVLLMGWGFVGLAGVALVANILQVIILFSMLRSTLFKPEWIWDWSLQKWMLRVSGPLMINHLLATIFWRIDIWILRPLAGAASVGLYSVALKYLDGLNIIPSVFTMAIFPLMSRYARRDDDGLLRSYLISIRLLLMVSLPIAVTFTLLAKPLVWLVGGAQYIDVPETINFFGRNFTYLGGSNLALQIIIWSIPIGFINSVTQFVLIAVDQQRYLTKAFIIGVVFNTVGNLLLIPTFGYVGAAVITILSEFSLLFPFYYSVKRNVGVVPWARIVTPPALGAAAMLAAAWLMTSLGLIPLVAVIIGWPVYVIALAFAGGFRGEDMEVIVGKLPLGPLRRVVMRTAE